MAALPLQQISESGENTMQSGDRVMVFDSPGFPLPHYLYASVLTPTDAGALVQIDHPGNVSHGTQRFAPADKIMRKGDALRLADEAEAELATARDADQRKKLMEQVKHYEFVAEQLSE
jgi:hypothetical protein